MDIGKQEVETVVSHLKEVIEDFSQGYTKCVPEHSRDAISLILRQQAEIERLKSEDRELSILVIDTRISKRDDMAYGKHEFCLECSQHNGYNPSLAIRHSEKCMVKKAINSLSKAPEVG